MSLTLGGVVFPTPLADLDASPDKIGGMHELLSGDTAFDLIAVKRRWQPSWIHLTDAQYAELLELYRDPGPLALTLPDDTTATVWFLNLNVTVPMVGLVNATAMLRER